MTDANDTGALPSRQPRGASPAHHARSRLARAARPGLHSAHHERGAGERTGRGRAPDIERRARGPDPPAADASTREALDAALARARTASEYLLAGRRYRSLGLDRQAKEAVDRAARVATAASEWHGIAASFDALGYREAADEARRRAQNAPLR